MTYTETRFRNTGLRQVTDGPLSQRPSSQRRGSRHPLIDSLAANRRIWIVSGIRTNVDSMFIIPFIEIIHRRDEAGGGRTAHGESENVCTA